MELIKFTLNHWNSGFGYPAVEPFYTWMNDDHITEYLGNDKWCKEQGISVVMGLVDMSYDFSIIAPRDWVEKNCPEIIGSEFEFPIDDLINNWYTPFAPNYEDFIGCYQYVDDWDYDTHTYGNPFLIHMVEWGKFDGEEISVKNIIDEARRKYGQVQF